MGDLDSPRVVALAWGHTAEVGESGGEMQLWALLSPVSGLSHTGQGGISSSPTSEIVLKQGANKDNTNAPWILTLGCPRRWGPCHQDLTSTIQEPL